MATTANHERVDMVFSKAQLGERAAYGRFLLAQAAAHLPTEQALEQGGIEELVPDWTARRRAESLKADLRDLGLDLPAPAGAPAFETREAQLGALYVLEGSRLGGTLLKRSVPADFPSRFLGNVDSAAWQALLARLDAALDSEDRRAAAIAGARQVFDLFEASGRAYLDGDG
ncbi:biliverdin-producing heme oxygenase [Sphingomonas sp. KR3-1]|uniref:biliverdin-producing heme oxygenase n=1 Tax=Sphingomonas sp. KR3-1 TaxID=3156611 RepID=UPI0032B37718